MPSRSVKNNLISKSFMFMKSSIVMHNIAFLNLDSMF